MPLTDVHFNGSVNMRDAETVLRELGARVGGLAHAYPDGETGDRNVWVFFQMSRLQAADGLVDVEPRKVLSDASAEDLRTDFLQVRLADGVEPGEVDFHSLGYADEYIASYETFRRLRDEGVVPDGVRFQVQYPTPAAVVLSFVAPEDQDRVLLAYERALFADLDRFLASVPREDVKVQWDVAFEIGLMEGLLGPRRDAAAIAPDLARCIDAVPEGVPVGLHLCYGDYKHKHGVEPRSLQVQVDLTNAALGAAQRNVDFVSFTVPQYQDSLEFFEPLDELAADRIGHLYFGIVPYYPADQAAGTTERQIELIDRYVDDWGVCAECGLGRVADEDVARLVDIHRELVEVNAQASA